MRTRCREGSFRSESANCGASGWNLLTGPEQPLAVAVTGRIAQVSAHDAAEVEVILGQLRSAGVRVEDLEIGRADLEDVFLEIMASGDGKPVSAAPVHLPGG